MISVCIRNKIKTKINKIPIIRLCHNYTTNTMILEVIREMILEVIPHYAPTRLGTRTDQFSMMSYEWLLVKWFGK